MTKQNIKLLKHFAITLLFPALAVQFYSGGTGAGNCLSYDGMNDYVLINRNASIEPQNITIETWIYPTNWPNLGSGNGIIHKRNPIPPYDGYYLQLWNDGDIQKLSYVNKLDIDLIFAHSMTLNQWYHVSVTHNGTVGKMYINGIEVINADVGSLTNDITKDLYVGRREDINFFFNGKIDEVRIWNRALTQDEIRQNMCQKLKGNESGLVGYWRFDEGSGNTVYDASGNGNNGTLY